MNEREGHKKEGGGRERLGCRESRRRRGEVGGKGVARASTTGASKPTGYPRSYILTLAPLSSRIFTIPTGRLSRILGRWRAQLETTRVEGSAGEVGGSFAQR